MEKKSNSKVTRTVNHTNSANGQLQTLTAFSALAKFARKYFRP
jgi:hypothetical protein